MNSPGDPQIKAPIKAQIKKRTARAIAGTHERVVEIALRHLAPGSTALELGAWSGALTERLLHAGFQVTSADIADCFELDTKFVRLDLNDPYFDRLLTPGFALVTAVEVIEHLENPSGFLRCIARVLRPGGIAILTTPNVENVPARLKFLVRGEVRTMDRHNPEHITPIHLDLFVRRIVPASGLVLLRHSVYPENAFPLTGRRWMTPFFRLLMPLLRGPALAGDTHFFVLQKPGELATE